MTSFLFKNLISFQITASGFSPQVQGLKRKELLPEDEVCGVFTWLKEQGLSDVHCGAFDGEAGVGDAAMVSQPSVLQVFPRASVSSLFFSSRWKVHYSTAATCTSWFGGLGT